MEDQADEDFFDKLVNDDDNADVNCMSSSLDTTEPSIAHRNESHEVNDLSFSEEGNEIDDKGKVQDDEKDVKGIGEKNNVLESESSFELASVSATDITEKSTVLDSAGSSSECANNGALQTEASSDALSKSKGSGVTGVKEVEWSVFTADSAQDNGNGSGSFSDFFTKLGDDSGDLSRDVVDSSLTDTANTSSGRDTHESVYLENSDHGMYKQGYNGAEVQQSFGNQDLANNQNWENLYPGWRYDASTGQWYQIDGYETGSNANGNTNWNSTSNWSGGMTEVSYLPQSIEHSTGTVADIGANESITNWNQATGVIGNASHWNQDAHVTSTSTSMTYWNQAPSTNNGYPSHMVFDPQYPGWYYDTIAQEWQTLEAYNLSYAQGQNQLKQNGFTSSETFINNDNQKTFEACSQVGNHNSQVLGSQGQDMSWSGSSSNFGNQGSNYGQNQQLGSQYGQDVFRSSHVAHQVSYDSSDTIPYEITKKVENEPQSFTSRGSFDHQYNPPGLDTSEHKLASNGYFNHQSSLNFPQQQVHGSHQSFYAPTSGRSSAGRPPHALVTFGFGGKLIVAKEDVSRETSSLGSQNPVGGSLKIINLSEVVTKNADGSSSGLGASDYLRTLCRQSFPGPLHCGSGGVKELNRWFEERIGTSDPPNMDNRHREMLLLLSLLKLSCQYYGKLRSPIGSDTVLKESDVPEAAVARLFASSRTNAMHLRQNGAAHCLQKLPSEGQMRATAAEVQNLLVCGKKREALHGAQEGHLWGPALVLAAQLGDQFYVDTVKQMSLRQLVPGSPLRTLCLLIAGQHAEVFKFDASANSGMFGDDYMNQQAVQYSANSMLDDWEENLAVIVANRTKDDELVLINLGDCMWKDKNDVVAAHICYLVAEANFEPYSDTARLCLVGADHWKSPRTYASPEAIQRTQIYEYSKVLGNSQFVLLPFQPYKLIYAYMLAEVGRLSDASKYCQSVLKSLKTGRAPELENLRHSVSALEERIKNHQQGGFATNLDPTRFMGKLRNLFDSTANRVVGGSLSSEHHQTASKVQTCQSTAEMSSLINSTSPVSNDERGANSTRRPKHNRSVSEPDIGRSPRQDFVDSSNEASGEGEKSGGRRSRLGGFGFGSHLLQKTVGLVLGSRQGRQAKLGEKNKFYYDEKLKRWVEEGAEPPAEEVAPAAPPTTTSMGAFQNGMSDYNLKAALSKEVQSSNGSPDSKNNTSMGGRGSGIPPLPPTSNQYSVRGRMGVRSRYVDTFNKGGGTPTNSFQSPAIPSTTKPTTTTTSSMKTNFFVPAAVNNYQENTESTSSDNNNRHITSLSDENHHSHENVPPGPGPAPAPSSSTSMQRFGSMDDISSHVTAALATTTRSSSAHHRRGASWGGSLGGNFNPPPLTGDVSSMTTTPSFMLPVPVDSCLVHQSAGGSGNYSDELQEVEL